MSVLGEPEYQPGMYASARQLTYRVFSGGPVQVYSRRYGPRRLVSPHSSLSFITRTFLWAPSIVPMYNGKYRKFLPVHEARFNKIRFGTCALINKFLRNQSPSVQVIWIGCQCVHTPGYCVLSRESLLLCSLDTDWPFSSVQISPTQRWTNLMTVSSKHEHICFTRFTQTRVVPRYVPLARPGVFADFQKSRNIQGIDNERYACHLQCAWPLVVAYLCPSEILLR